jgi:hypothetical protein
MALIRDSSLYEVKDSSGLGGDSQILLINTEGDTDPTNYRKLIHQD